MSRTDIKKVIDKSGRNEKIYGQCAVICTTLEEEEFICYRTIN